jgi:hypothetical protein
MTAATETIPARVKNWQRKVLQWGMRVLMQIVRPALGGAMAVGTLTLS